MIEFGNCVCILGAHFENFADSKGNSTASKAPEVKTVDTQGADMKVRSSTNPRQATSEDDKKLQEILSDPDLKEILLDVRIQKLLETLRTDPDKAQR